MNYISRMHGTASMLFSTIIQLSKIRISVHQLFIEQLTELPTILDSFYQYHKCLHRDGELKVVGSYSSGEI